MEKYWRRRMFECISIFILSGIVKSENTIESCVFSDESGFCRKGSGKFLPKESNVPTLFIVECDMTSLIAEDFSGYSSLLTLHLHNTSLPIPYLEKSLLAKLPGLQALEITDVVVTENHFDELIHVPNLRSLTLKWTNLTSINKRMFEHTKKLQSLDFSFNDIWEIEDGTFDDLPEIQTVDLSFNRIGWDFHPAELAKPNKCVLCDIQNSGNGIQIELPSEYCTSSGTVDELWRLSVAGGDIRLEMNPLCSKIEDGNFLGEMDTIKTAKQSESFDTCHSLYFSGTGCPEHKDRCQFLQEACAATTESIQPLSGATPELVRKRRSDPGEKHEEDAKKDRSQDHGGRGGKDGSHEGDRAHGGSNWYPKSWGPPPPGWVAPTGHFYLGQPPSAWGPPPWNPTGWGPPRWGPPSPWGAPGYAPGQWYPGIWQQGTTRPPGGAQDAGREELDMEGAKDVIGGAGSKKKEDSDDTSAETLPPLLPKTPAGPKATVAPPPDRRDADFATSEEAESVAKTDSQAEPPERQAVETAGVGPAPAPAPARRGLLVPLVCGAAGVIVVATIATAVCVVRRRGNVDARGNFQELEAMRGKREDPEGGGEDNFEEVLLRGVETKKV